MILELLKLVNFRQFYGEQCLTFASGGERNVTIVFGANGAGKSTLLSAFTWCLYETTSPGLQDPSRIINLRAWDEAPDGADVEARVLVRFRHDDGNTYEVARVVAHRKHGDQAIIVKDGGSHHVRVTITENTGETRPSVGNPSDIIQQILPLELHRYFFFDGERMDELVKKQDNKQLEKKRTQEFADATRKLLGLELIERAVHHTGLAKNQFQGELSRAAPSNLAIEMQRIQSRIDMKCDEIDELKEKLADAKANLNALEFDKEAVDDQLRKNEKSQQLQRELDGAVKRRHDLDADLRRASDRQKSIIARSGMLAFTGELTRQVMTRFEEIRERGQIPTKIKRQFVEDLLKSQQCICGTALTDGSQERTHVETWRKAAAAQGAEESWASVTAFARSFNEGRQELFADLKGVVAEIARIGEDRSEASDRISELQTLLKGVDSSEIQALATSQADLTSRINDTIRDIGGYDMAISERVIDVEKDRKELHEKLGREEKAQLALQRMDVANAINIFFESLLALKTAETREEIDRQIKAVFQKITFKDYVPSLSSEFQLNLYRRDGSTMVPVAASTGENQILSLSFVGAIAEYAKRLTSQAASLSPLLAGFGGGTYPIVMDSPFGALDENYRQDIARAVPRLADQVVVLVSKSQGLGEVLDEVAPRVGRRYVIAYHSPKPELDAEMIELGGHQYPYIVPSETEWAEIQEV